MVPRVQTPQACTPAAGIESLFLRAAPRGFFPSGRTPCVLPIRVGGIDGCFGGRFRAGHIGAFRLTGWFFDFVFTQASGASGSSCVSCHGAGVNLLIARALLSSGLPGKSQAAIILRILFIASNSSQEFPFSALRQKPDRILR